MAGGRPSGTSSQVETLRHLVRRPYRRSYLHFQRAKRYWNRCSFIFSKAICRAAFASFPFRALLPGDERCFQVVSKRLDPFVRRACSGFVRLQGTIRGGPFPLLLDRRRMGCRGYTSQPPICGRRMASSHTAAPQTLTSQAGCDLSLDQVTASADRLPHPRGRAKEAPTQSLSLQRRQFDTHRNSFRRTIALAGSADPVFPGLALTAARDVFLMPVW